MYPFFCNFRKFRYLCISNRKARPSRASFRPDFRLQKSTTSPDGGIGRRAGLKHQWSNPCRFDPGSGYKQKRLSITLGLFCLYPFSTPVSCADSPFQGHTAFRSRFSRASPLHLFPTQFPLDRWKYGKCLYLCPIID